VSAEKEKERKKKRWRKNTTRDEPKKGEKNMEKGDEDEICG
jgi:hypothetical protein